MKVSHSKSTPSELVSSIFAKSMQEITYGKMSEEEGIEVINSAISQAISDGMMSPQDVLSLSDEALQREQDAQKQSFTMKSDASRAAEHAARQPKSNQNGTLLGSFMGKVADAEQEFAGGMSTKLLKEMMPIIEEISEELAELNEEKRKIALEEAAQKLQAEKENIRDDAVESGKETSSDSGNSSNPDTKPVEPDNNSEQVASVKPVVTDGDVTNSEPILTTGNGDNVEPVLTTGSEGSSEPVLTTGSADSAEPVLTTGYSSGSSSESKIITESLGGFEGLEVSTGQKPSAPSIDLFV